jgi:hypothetical protein
MSQQHQLGKILTIQRTAIRREYARASQVTADRPFVCIVIEIEESESVGSEEGAERYLSDLRPSAGSKVSMYAQAFALNQGWQFLCERDPVTPTPAAEQMWRQFAAVAENHAYIPAGVLLQCRAGVETTTLVQLGLIAPGDLKPEIAPEPDQSPEAHTQQESNALVYQPVMYFLLWKGSPLTVETPKGRWVLPLFLSREHAEQNRPAGYDVVAIDWAAVPKLAYLASLNDAVLQQYLPEEGYLFVPKQPRPSVLDN